MMRRYEISDEKWERIREMLPGKEGDVGRMAKDNRLFVNGVLWVLHSGASWADMPERYGKYKSVHQRYSRWCKSGVWQKIQETLSADGDHDVTQACQLLEGQKADYVLADRGYIQAKLFEKICRMGAKPIIPHRRNQLPNKDFDPVLYKDRHLIEYLFSKIKHCRRSRHTL